MLKYNLLAVFCLGLFLLAGCSGASDRHGLEGTVTLDSEPLSQGMIVFRPIQGTKSPTAGGQISGGKFTVEPEKGPSVGKFCVEITATQHTGRKVPGALGGQVDEVISIIPPQYNRQSTLTAEVTASGPNSFEFVLRSK